MFIETTTRVPSGSSLAPSTFNYSIESRFFVRFSIALIVTGSRVIISYIKFVFGRLRIPNLFEFIQQSPSKCSHLGADDLHKIGPVVIYRAATELYARITLGFMAIEKIKNEYELKMSFYKTGN